MFYLLTASLKSLWNVFLYVLGVDVKLHLNPHFLTISRSTEICSITVVGVTLPKSEYLTYSIISITLSVIEIHSY